MSGAGRVLLLYANAYAVPLVWLAFLVTLIGWTVVEGRRVCARLGWPTALGWLLALAVAGPFVGITIALLPVATLLMRDNNGQIILAVMAGMVALATLILGLRLAGAVGHRARGVRFVLAAAPARAGGTVSGHFEFPPGRAPAGRLAASLRCVERNTNLPRDTVIWSDTMPVLGSSVVAFNPPASCPASRPFGSNYIVWEVGLAGALRRGRIDAVFEIHVAGADGATAAAPAPAAPRPANTRIASRALPDGAVEFHVPASHSLGLGLMWGGFALLTALPMALLPLPMRALVILGIACAAMTAALVATVFGETWLTADAHKLDVRAGLFGLSLWRWSVPAAEIAELSIGHGGSRGTVALRLKRRDGRLHHLCSAMGNAAAAQWLAAELRRQLRLP